jgi:hypothetical protein
VAVSVNGVAFALYEMTSFFVEIGNEISSGTVHELRAKTFITHHSKSRRHRIKTNSENQSEAKISLVPVASGVAVSSAGAGSS